MLLLTGLGIVVSLSAPVSATTLLAMGLSDMLTESEAVVEGQVTALEVILPGGLAAKGASHAMIYTRVSMRVTRELAGSVGKTLDFTIAGGSAEGMGVAVVGMPDFEVGKRYLLFLRKGYESVADPITGLSQGYFQIVPSEPEGRDVLLTSGHDTVVGIESDRVLSEPDSLHTGRRSQASQKAPKALWGVPRPPVVSQEAQQRAARATDPMTLEAFRHAIRSKRETSP